MAAPGVTLVKYFNYRGNPNEEWSNQYHFVGDAPSTPTDWQNLIDALVTLEKATLTDENHYARAYGYENTDNDAVYVKDWVADGGGATGTLDHTGSPAAPGDVAMWVRWKTARTNTKGKPIYLRKYFHGVCVAGTTTDLWDVLWATQQTAGETFGAAVNAASGDWPGIAGPDGVAPGDTATSHYVTTRTLKRRGPRPH